jgi:hypothetical protein
MNGEWTGEEEEEETNQTKRYVKFSCPNATRPPNETQETQIHEQI